MSDPFDNLRAADPLRGVELATPDANSAFAALGVAILSGELTAGEDIDARPTSDAGGRRTVAAPSGRSFRVALIAVAVAVVLVAASLAIVFGSSTSQSGPGVSLPRDARVTPWHAARTLPVTFHVASTGHTSESWQLVSLVVNAGWNVDTSGPPPAWLTCPTVSACYALAVRYTSPKAGAVPQSVSFYVSSDLGTTWSVLPMPAGFLPTARPSCPSSQVCAVGGTSTGKPVFAVTIDGGHQWGVVPIGGSSVLRELACPSNLVCVGVLGSPDIYQSTPATSLVRTTDGGASWTTSPVPVTGTLLAVSCATSEACVALGYTGPQNGNPPGFVLTSSNGGQSWVAGTLPRGFGFSPPLSAISCASASSCMAIGSTTVLNPMQCGGTPPHVVPPGGFDSCDTSPTTEVSGVITSSDGGISWHVRSLPADVPVPQLYSLSCASATVCWAAGQESVPEVIGNVHDEGSPVVVGTTDGGATWSKSTFTIPAGAPNYLGQAYLSIGDMSCPAPSACLAIGGGAQSAPSTPIYRFGTAGAS